MHDKMEGEGTGREPKTDAGGDPPVSDSPPNWREAPGSSATQRSHLEFTGPGPEPMRGRAKYKGDKIHDKNTDAGGNQIISLYLQLYAQMH